MVTTRKKTTGSIEPLRAVKPPQDNVPKAAAVDLQWQPPTSAKKQPRRRFSLPAAGWTVSICIHIALAVAFLLAVPNFTPDRQQRQVPKASIENSVEQLPTEPLVMETEPLATDLETTAPMPEAVNLMPQIPQGNAPASKSPVIAAWGASLSGGQASAGPKVAVGSSYAGSFCGVAGSADRICFVVDCSGSMIIAFDSVRQELKRAVGKLSPGQYFQVIFFAGGQPTEMASGVLTRANAPKRNQALAFIEQAELTDVPNRDVAWQALADALEMAFKARTFDGRGAKLIYLFTDGQFDHEKISQTLQSLQARSSELVTVNVIACGVGLNKDFLRALARQYRGEFRFISDEELAGAEF